MAPVHNNLNPVAEFDVVRDFDLKGLVWYARPKLFFNCTVCSCGCQGPEYSANYKEATRFKSLSKMMCKCKNKMFTFDFDSEAAKVGGTLKC